jgi:hypothetical protein
MHAQPFARAGHDQARRRQRSQCRPHRVTIDRLGREHAFGAIAVRGVAVAFDTGKHADGGVDRGNASPTQRRPAAQHEILDALEQFDETHRAGIDDAGAAQHGKCCGVSARPGVSP